MERRLLLSDLPEDIIRRILFPCLVSKTNRELVHLSLLSKQFSSVVQNRPTLTFGRYSIFPLPERRSYKKRPEEELNYIISTLERYDRENIHLESFTLFPDDPTEDYYPIYSTCVEMAAKRSVKKLRIIIMNSNDDDSNYIIPQAVFKVKSLVELDLTDCCLQPKNRVVWRNLKKLDIFGCQASDEEFEYIIGGCPSIEDMHIVCPRSSNSIFNLSDLCNLKKLHFLLGDHQRLEMNASTLPNVECIKCSQGHVDLGDAEYPNLTNLYLFNCGGMDDHFFNNFARKFPKLENLSLGCSQIQRINLTSPSLKKMKLLCTMTLQEMCFNLPNVVCFAYSGSDIINFPKLSFAGNSGGWSSHIFFSEYKFNIDALWFLELKIFLAALNNSETSIDVQIHKEEDEEEDEEDEDLTIVIPVIPVQGIKEFSMLELKNWSGFSSEIFDCILLICQPQTITFRSCESYEMPELLYKKLMPTSGQDHRGVVDFEISYMIDYTTFQTSVGFKEWDKFLKVLKDAGKERSDVSFHLKY